MKLAVISDIHGNYKALEAFLSCMEEKCPDEIICLGDYITDGPYPERTLALLYRMRQQYACRFIQGNREEYILTNHYSDQQWKPSSATGTLHYTAEHVTEGDIRFFESLPGTKVLRYEGCPDITICHGSPEQIRGNFKEDRELMRTSMENLATPWLLGGHSHQQEIQAVFGRTYLNPGALGLAIDGVGGQAQYAFLYGKEGRWIPELISIPYDLESYLQDFTESGLDDCGMVLNRAIKKTLMTGINYFYNAILEAERMDEREISRIPEDIWEAVAEKLEL